jgi:hypothetical protein
MSDEQTTVEVDPRRRPLFEYTGEWCGHGKIWDEDCAECDDIWRKDQIAYYAAAVRRYGFRLEPL